MRIDVGAGPTSSGERASLGSSTFETNDCYEESVPGASPEAGPLAELSPRLIGHAQALGGEDMRLALMAMSLSWLSRLVPVSLGLFYTVDRRLMKFTGEVVVARTARAPALDLPWTLLRYLRRDHAVDPFAPRRFSASPVSVVDLADVGDPDVTASSHYVGGYLQSLGACGQTTLHLRAGGQIIAGVDLLRTPEDPEITGGQLALVRSSQPLLEHAYACVANLTAARQHEGFLAPAGLSRREREVARLVGAGASNREVGQALSISPATVKTHLVRVFEKLNVRSRSQLAALLSAARDTEPEPVSLARLPVVL